MPTQVNRSYVFKTAGGQDIVMSHEEALSQRTETDIDFVCDGPRCASRHDSDEPVKFSYREEEATKNPESLPDSFFRFIPPFLPYMGDTSVIVGFCSAQCAKDWFTYSYQPPLSPREKTEQAKREQSAKLIEMNPHLVRKPDDATRLATTPDGLPSEADLDADAREKEIAAITASTQADGFSDPGDEHQ